jgi:hypothetical protein
VNAGLGVVRRSKGSTVLDLAGILFSSVMMIYVIIQAIRLDGARPWFELPPRPSSADPQPRDAADPPTHPVVPWRERRR